MVYTLTGLLEKVRSSYWWPQDPDGTWTLAGFPDPDVVVGDPATAVTDDDDATYAVSTWGTETYSAAVGAANPSVGTAWSQRPFARITAGTDLSALVAKVRVAVTAEGSPIVSLVPNLPPIALSEATYTGTFPWGDSDAATYSTQGPAEEIAASLPNLSLGNIVGGSLNVKYMITGAGPASFDLKLLDLTDGYRVVADAFCEAIADGAIHTISIPLDGDSLGWNVDGPFTYSEVATLLGSGLFLGVLYGSGGGGTLRVYEAWVDVEAPSTEAIVGSAELDFELYPLNDEAQVGYMAVVVPDVPLDGVFRDYTATFDPGDNGTTWDEVNAAIAAGDYGLTVSVYPSNFTWAGPGHSRLVAQIASIVDGEVVTSILLDPNLSGSLKGLDRQFT